MSATNLLVLDGLLVISLVGLAWAALAGSDARRSVILFMAFGLVLAAAWVRLLAPDVALAEAAIGSGLAGALLLAAVQEQPRQPLAARTASNSNPNKPGLSVALQLAVSVLCAALAGTLAWALAHAFNSAPQNALPRAVSSNLEASGVSNPVTAVLLNFRAYDTLLELAVLLTAVLGIFALGPARPGYQAAGPVFDGLARWLVPVLILTAGYLLWVGAHAPGGAFQAGATLAAASVVLRLAGRHQIGLPQGRALRIVMAGGVGTFVLIGLGLLVTGRPFLGYPPAWAGGLILMIESAATLAIAATLVLAFLGGQPRPLAVRVTCGNTSATPGPTGKPASPEGMRGAELRAAEVCNRIPETQKRC